MNSQPLRAFLYARRSSDERSDKQLQSISDQVNVLKPIAARHRLKIVDILEESKSAKQPHMRPVFSDMLNRIRNGEAEVILTWHPNRLFRNPVDQGELTWMLQSGQIRQIVTPLHVYHPEDSVILLSLEGAMANQYSRDLSNAVRRGLTHKANSGKYPGQAPQGYFNYRDGDFAEIRPDKARWDMVRRMWELLLSGNHTVPEIRDIATREWGYLTPRKKRKGGQSLGQNSLYKLFANPFYAGLFLWKGEFYHGKHKPMITIDEFDRAQAILGRKGRPRPQTHKTAYTGLIRCGECGHMITCTVKRKLIKRTGEFKHFTYYHCHKKKRDERGKAACSQKPVTLEVLETQIEAELGKYTISPAFKAWAFSELELHDKHEVEQRNVILNQQQDAANQNQREIDNLRRMRMRDLIDDDEYREEKSKLKLTRAKLKALMNSSENRAKVWDDLTDQAFEFITDLPDRFQNGTIDQKRELFSALGSNFVLKDKIVSIEATEWLVPMAKVCPALDAEFHRLELDENLDVATRNKRLADLIILVRTVVCDVRTVFQKSSDTSIKIPPRSN